MRTINQYVYVDTFSQCMKTGRPTKWERLRDTEVLKKISKNDGKKHEYYSVQAYRNATAIRDLVAGDPVDREPPSNGHDVEEHERTLREAEPDLMPDAQLHYCGLYFDFDCDPDKLNIGEDEALQRAQADAHKLAEWFRKVFDLNPAHVQVFYSGRKGFHVMVHPEPFGIYPHKHLTYICQRVALQLKDELVLDTLDTAVYTISRMWRVVNTRHPKSGRYKVEMTLDELASMTPAEIRKLASTTRVEIEKHPPFGSVIWPPEEYEDIDVDDVAKAWWREFVDLYDAYRSMQKLSPRRPITTPPGGDYPACVQDILDNGPKDGGPNRNRVLLPIAGFLSDAGLDQREAYSILEQWTNDFYPDRTRIKQRLQNAKTVVTAAYRGQLHFSCRAIRANRGAGAKGRVTCVGEDACPWIREVKDQEPVEVPLVHLAEATNGCYIDGKVRTPVHVSALAGNPWGVPIKGKMRCVPNPEQSMCQRCPNIDTGGKMSFTLTANDCAVLEIVNCPNTHRRNGLKRYCGIPNDCTAVSIEPEQRTNLQDSEIIPMVDYERIYTRDDEEENELGGKGSKHVQRRALFLGEGLEANKKYIIEASVLEDPRNQRICFLFDKLEPAQDDIDKFEMTPTLYNNLKLFQPEDGESIEEKLDKIHTDLEANVHQIGGRRDLSVAIDLAYHSVIGFDLMGMPVVKGWFELLIMGDSASGKSTMMDRLMQHFGLGEMIAGEEAKRTGLVHNTTQLQKTWVLKWGKIPQNDRRLLVIDEFAGIDPEEVAKLTQLRSEGKARGSGVTSDHETWARTRLILLTNPKNNSAELAAYNYGIDAIRHLFKELQDTRRVDLALIAERSEVSTDMLNRRWDLVNEPHIYTSDICQKLVLWAWSREPKDVVWSVEAVERVRHWAEVLGDTYACDIPLAERADLKLKLARIAAATAARMFSTDAEGVKLFVNADHVDFVADFMDRAYRKPAMSYMEYARRWKAENLFTEKRRASIVEALQSFDDVDTLVAALLDENVFPKSKLRDTLDLETDEFDRLWKLMLRQRLLKSTARGYRKTPAFTKMLKAMKSRKSGYADDGRDPFDDSADTAPNYAEEAPF